MQRGGDGYAFQGAAFDAAGPMAPIESRVSFSHCGTPARPGSLVGGSRKRRARRSKKQRGGACGGGCAPMQLGGGGGTGGYGFALSNELGKIYPSLTVGACAAAQRGGANMMETRAIDNSFSAGYGYGKESAMEVGGGTAHFLAQLPYGRQCMGGGARRRKNKKSHKARRMSRRKSTRRSARR